MDTLISDVRYSIRVLARRPGASFLIILTLGLGIGANCAIFSVVNAVLLRQLPFKDPERLVWIWSTRTDRDKATFSIPDYLDYREQNRSLDSMVAFVDWSANLTDRGDPERLQGVRISADVFQMLGAKSVRGRTLLPDDDNSSSERVVVLSYGLWQRRFGSDSSIVGKTLTLNGAPYQVVGVLDPDFTFPGSKAEMAVPLSPDTDPRRSDRKDNFLRVVGRLKPNVSLARAQSDLNGIAFVLRDQYPEANARKTAVRLIALRDELVGDYRTALLALFGAVGLILLVACANVANFLLARASAREKEIAVRAALGAMRGRLVRQFLTESMVLALFGGVLGVSLAWWGTKLLIALSPSDLPRAKDISLDPVALGFTLILSILAGLLVGLFPALHTSKVGLCEHLKEGGRGSSSVSVKSRLRSLLIVGEIAVSLILLIGAGLLIQSFLRLQRVNPGFNEQNLLLLRMALPRERYSKPEAVSVFYQKVYPRIQSLPGVKAAGAASIVPLSGLNARIEFTVAGRPPASKQDTPAAQYRMISPNYFETMGIALLSGRDFTEQDKADAHPVAIINETLAKRYFPDGSAIGAHLNLDDGAPSFRDVEIVGIAGDVKQVGLDDESTSDVYVPFYQIPAPTVVYLTNNLFWAVRSNSEPLSLAASVRREIQSVDKDIPTSSIKSMEQFVAASVAPRRFNLILFDLFAAAALLLAATGVYAVVSYSVSQRTHEIGIRMALGAEPRDVIRLIVRSTLRLILIGVGVGLIGAFLFSKWISNLLFAISPLDAASFTAIPVFLVLVALVASYIPARKAIRVDPVTALRFE